MNKPSKPVRDSKTSPCRVAFLGGGNMGAALARGLLANGWEAGKIRVIEPGEQRRQWLKTNLGLDATADAVEAVQGARAIVLAVKPQQMEAALQGLKLPSDSIAISIAAGVRLANLRAWLGPQPALVRCMPNTPALVGAGATALYAQSGISQPQRKLAETVLKAAGPCCWVENEAQLDVVTALSGSGPAYFFALVEAMQSAGTALGLPGETAALLARQTLVGAGRLTESETADVGTLRQRVTSKGGTTAAALAAFESGGLTELVTRAMYAAEQRSRELGGTPEN